jgi:hypothetical protein
MCVCECRSSPQAPITIEGSENGNTIVLLTKELRRLDTNKRTALYTGREHPREQPGACQQPK